MVSLEPVFTLLTTRACCSHLFLEAVPRTKGARERLRDFGVCQEGAWLKIASMEQDRARQSFLSAVRPAPRSSFSMPTIHAKTQAYQSRALYQIDGTIATKNIILRHKWNMCFLRIFIGDVFCVREDLEGFQDLF